MKALLFGSIGTVVDSSALQLEAFNRAFADAGLDWHWSREDYEKMLADPGGRERVRRHARQVEGQEPEAARIDALHARKAELFIEMLLESDLQARPGVRRLMDEAQAAGVKVGLVTSTDLVNVRAVLAVAGDSIRLERFDVLTHRGTVPACKPDPAPWQRALGELGLEPTDAVAIEDTGVCVDCAVAAGMFCIATPNSHSGGMDFRRAHAIVDHLGDLRRPARHLAGRPIVSDGLVTLERLAQQLTDAS